MLLNRIYLLLIIVFVNNCFLFSQNSNKVIFKDSVCLNSKLTLSIYISRNKESEYFIIDKKDMKSIKKFLDSNFGVIENSDKIIDTLINKYNAILQISSFEFNHLFNIDNHKCVPKFVKKKKGVNYTIYDNKNSIIIYGRINVERHIKFRGFLSFEVCYDNKDCLVNYGVFISKNRWCASLAHE